MARRHVVNYFLELQALLIELLDALQEYNTAYEEGYLTEEQEASMKKEIEIIKGNYEFMGYVMMLLNKPNRKDKQETEFQKGLYERVKGKSREAVLDESKNALADITEILKEADRRMREEK